MTEVLPTIDRVPGFQVAGVHCGLKADGALDFALIVSDRPCVAAGVFTTNQVKAAPVLVDQEKLKRSPTSIRAVAVNTRCANACTGQQGIDNAHQMARWVAEALGCAEDEVLVMSTGVIGTQLPMEKIKRGVELASDSLGEANWEAAARAIMTTDTRPKLAAVRDEGCTVAGIAKGAGMIAPNMATMLSVIVTDARLDADSAGGLLRAASAASFNRVVVDGDTSTNDTVLLLGSGRAGVAAPSFASSLHSACVSLAQSVVRDGEGVTKFITLHVSGAPTEAEASAVANTIATSPLVKTAFYGGDANWGRIIAAAGRSGVSVQPEAMQLRIGTGEREAALLLFTAGMPTHYDEGQASAIMAQPDIHVWLDLGMGSAAVEVWTCDLSHDYVSINGHYRS